VSAAAKDINRDVKATLNGTRALTLFSFDDLPRPVTIGGQSRE
jgi:hypothetical protein